MIYDGHAYCFPDQKGDGGFADRKEFQRLLQLAMARHFQPAWRKRDRAPADSTGLADPSPHWSFDALKEAQFRPAGHGRFEWIADGEDYVKQVMPPLVVDMSYLAESLVAEMDYAGVDRALLHRTPYLGISNEFIADCVQRFPDRLQGLAYVEEWLIPQQPDKSIQKLERAIKGLGLSGLQFLPNFLGLYGQTEDWDSEGFRPFWDAVAWLNIPMFFTLLSVRRASPEDYLSEMRRLRRWMDRYPGVKVVLTHGFDWRYFVEGDTLSIPDEVFEAAPTDNPNFSVQLLFAILLGGKWDYPMPQMRPALEKLVRRMGANRLLWGTDIPMVMRYYTYRQSLDYIRLYSDFLSPREVEQIVGGNMLRLMGIEEA